MLSAYVQDGPHQTVKLPTAALFLSCYLSLHVVLLLNSNLQDMLSGSRTLCGRTVVPEKNYPLEP